MLNRLKCGPVLCDQFYDLDTADFLGAVEGTNNTGELTAIAMAAKLAIALDYNGTVKVYYDFKYAAKAAQGLDLTKSNHTLVEATRLLTCEAAKRGVIFGYIHINSHTGDHLNDLADNLAKLGTAGVKL